MSPSATPELLPVAEAQRVHAVDVLRGVAVLGIFAMNIVSFALSGEAYTNPLAHGSFSRADRAAWYLCEGLFELKMMTLFSMLFGAGLVLMNERAASKGRSIAGVYYRRLGWLALIGLIHGYALWYGDILFMYALCGLILYPFRRKKPAVLIAIGLALMSVAPAISALMGWGMLYARPHAEAALGAIAAGEQPSGLQQGMLDMWTGFAQHQQTPLPEVIEEAIAKTGSYRQYIAENAVMTAFMQIFVTLLFGLWRCGGLMLVGMGLLKLGVLSGRSSTRSYAIMVAFGALVGVPLALLGAARRVDSGFDQMRIMLVDGNFNYVGSLIVALGYVGLVNLLLRCDVLRWMTARLGAVGRMALSNYLMQTIIGTTLFCGWGFGLWGRLGRADLLLVTLAVWVIQLLVSPCWLAHFRFGPAEWLWRSLTYWRVQPMRVPSEHAHAAAPV